jgi:hypothetical protein
VSLIMRVLNKPMLWNPIRFCFALGVAVCPLAYTAGQLNPQL